MATVLIVDDDPHLLAAFTTALVLQGYHVRSTSTFATALQLLETEQPVLVLLDLHLPEGGGADLLRRMRARMPQVPIVVVSGFLDDASRQLSLEAGATECWEKPVSLPGLRDGVARVLAKGQPPPA
jgi:DNA-binding response OmpR family regulator